MCCSESRASTWLGLTTKSAPGVLWGHVVAELDELVAEGSKLAVQGLAILALRVLLGGVDDLAGCLPPCVNCGLVDSRQGPQRLAEHHQYIKP